jgi:hypothetical protein
MAIIKATIEEVELDGDIRDDIPGIEATCTKCGHTTESYGQEGQSIRRCLVLLREECPQGESNFYIAE